MSPTIKQERAVQNITEKHCWKDALEDAGYSPVTAAKPKNVTETKGFKEAAEPLIKRLERQRDRTIKRLEEEMDEAKFGDLSGHLDRLTKQLQLLTGGSTENHDITFKWKIGD